MKKEHKIPVYSFSYSLRHYLTHPWVIFKELHTAWLNYYTRARRGFGWVDLWNLDTYTATMFANALDELADKSYGAPYGEGQRWATFEEWNNELHLLAKLIRIINTDVLIEKEEFEDKFHEWRAGLILIPIRNTSFYKEYVLPETDAQDIDKLTSYQKIQREKEALRKVIFKNLCEIWDSLWD